MTHQQKFTIREQAMLDYKERRQIQKENGMGRLNFELPIEDLKALKMLAVEWQCSGIDSANVSNLLRGAVKNLLNTKPMPDSWCEFVKGKKSC
jgi:hypothetical protein